MANKGFGFFDADTDFGVSVHGGNVEIDESAKDYINQYDAFIDDEKSMYIENAWKWKKCQSVSR